MPKQVNQVHVIMHMSARLEAIMEKLEEKGITTKKELEKREIELIREKLKEIEGEAKDGK